MSKKPKTTNRKKIPAGIYIRENADGSASFQAKFRSSRGDVKVNETETFDNLDDAISWLADRKAKFKLDGGVALKKLDKNKLNIPLRDVIDRYVKEIVELKDDPHKDRNLFNKLKQESWVDWPIGAVTNVEVQAYVDRRLREHKAASTINNALNKLSKVYRQAASASPTWNFVGLVNPTIGVQRPPADPPRFATMTDEELGRLLAECEKGPPYLIWIVKLAILTTMRAGEMRHLHWRHFHQVTTKNNVEGAYWHLPKTKNGETRNVPLLKEAEGVCLAMRKALPKREDGFVFGNPKLKAKDGGITEDMVSNAYRDAAKRAGFVDQAAIDEKKAQGKKPGFISSLTFHDLRHVSTTQLSNFYDSEMKLADVTGHKDLKTLRRYYNTDPETRVEMLHRGESKHFDEMKAFRKKLAEDKRKAEERAAAEHAAREEAERKVAELEKQAEEQQRMLEQLANMTPEQRRAVM